MEQENENKQYIIIKVDNENYGIDIQKVQIINRISKITRVPKTPKYIKGVINLRGDVVPVMSLREKLDMDQDEYTDDSRIIIIKTNDYLVGVLVDEVKEVLQLDMNCVEDVQGFSSKINNKFISGLGKLDNDIVILLNVDGLIKSEKQSVVK